MQPADIPISTDLLLPPGVVIMRSGIDQVIWADDRALEVTASRAVSPELREDARSVMESAPFVIRYSEAGTAVTCECCGTFVAEVPEGASAEGPDRHWKRAIWEPETWRKHTLRRCEWKRANP